MPLNNQIGCLKIFCPKNSAMRDTKKETSESSSFSPVMKYTISTDSGVASSEEECKGNDTLHKKGNQHAKGAYNEDCSLGAPDSVKSPAEPRKQVIGNGHCRDK